MERVRARVTITLKSDLCVSSGQAYAGIIDTDVCMDTYGFPYIPAKRLKGIMREAAELIGIEKRTIISLFGQGGSGLDDMGSRTIYLEDAMPEGTEKIRREISRGSKSALLTQNNILSLFTSVKGQTRLDENGVAEENTLRYTRTVNRYLPACIDPKQGEMVFLSYLEYAKEDESDIADIVKAVRHIGMDRNRGLGNVKCCLDTSEQKTLPAEAFHPLTNADGKTEIQYCLTADTPLLLSASRDAVSETYISGQTMLGALASVYLKTTGLTEPDDTFRQLFLSGSCVFHNLYITDGGRNEYVPAPLFVNRLKKTKQYVCTAAKIGSNDQVGKYDPGNGNQPKKLAGKYIPRNWETGILVLEPETDLVYHHSKKGAYDASRVGDDGSILYTQESLSKGQVFRGSILVESKYAPVIRSLLKSPMLRLGKSKSSQYGHCTCSGITERPYIPKKHSFQKDEEFFVVLESDCVIPGIYGYTTYFEDVQKHLIHTLGQQNVAAANEIYMATKVITGYHGKMNLKRTSVPAIAAGSAFALKALQECEIALDGVGSFQAEGFGKVRIIKKSSLKYQLAALSRIELKDGKSGGELQPILQEIAKKQLLEELKAQFVEKSSHKESNLNVSASLVGRITLMLKESEGTEDVLASFAERILSIKRVAERDEIIKKLGEKGWEVCQISSRKSLIKRENLKGIPGEVLEAVPDAEIENLWVDYLKFILLHTKYRLSAEKKASGKEIK